ncbi:leucine-rich repeat-containing protein 39-like [Ptychodera flava]|uniref:leucine-rich repeat-containing protein 39-like n=1 Tax=Ptychodera flava TaxID=63121 RepID=UPI00396A617F
MESNSFTSVSYNVIQLSQLQEVVLLKSSVPTFPRMICRIQSLKRLHFGFKDLPFRVTSLPDDVLITLPLEELYLYNCNFSLFPKVIFKIKTLKVLSLVWCKISDELNNLGELSNLKQLTLSCNELTSLPESIGNLSKLEVLHANKNKLASLPAVMKKLSKLKTIDLDDNPFSKGKSMACENKSSKVKSILSQAPVAQSGQRQPGGQKQKQSALTQDATRTRLSTPTPPSSLKFPASTQQANKQPGNEDVKATANITLGGPSSSASHAKQNNLQFGKIELKQTEPRSEVRSALSSSTYQHTDASPFGKSSTSSNFATSPPMTKTQSSSLPYPIQATTPMKSVAQQRQSSFITKKSEETLPQEQKKPSEELKRQRQLLKPTQQQRQHKPVEISGSSKTTATPMPGSSSASTHQIKLTQSSSLPYPLQATTPMKPVPQEKQRISLGNLGHQQSKAVEVPRRSTTGAATSKPASGIGKYPMERKPRGQAIIINNYKFVEMKTETARNLIKKACKLC